MTTKSTFKYIADLDIDTNTNTVLGIKLTTVKASSKTHSWGSIYKITGDHIFKGKQIIHVESKSKTMIRNNNGSYGYDKLGTEKIENKAIRFSRGSGFHIGYLCNSIEEAETIYRNKELTTVGFLS
jgi:hypothetical protein